ncbi:PLD nuclease N-terminal domain-containing protein [Streptomyces sp. NPDC002755]|uniref:PLD nuclease N-terminal domain-containing protein n=1 Tax=Streptomyces sp. NPDC002884 TaxID=3154544 RepID=UPI0033167BBE
MLGLLEPLAVAPMVLVAVLCVGALLDCVRTPEERVRYAPKLFWLFFLLGAPVVGGLAWLYLGKRPEPRESPEPTNSPEPTKGPETAENAPKGPAHRAGPFVQKR